jgi:predicted alpha/beta hydrolase family esterase
MGNESIRYLIVPGWQGSSDDHWQTHWQNSLPNSARVEQADWLTPRREDWIAALAEAIAADSTPVILIAHSLGCITVAHWAERAPASLLSQVRGALLVAPADVERPACAPALRNFAPIPTWPLPFPSQIVSSDNDCGRERTQGDGVCPPVGRGDRDHQRRRAHQRQVRASALGARFRLFVSPANPHRARRPAPRMIFL